MNAMLACRYYITLNKNVTHYDGGITANCTIAGSGAGNAVHTGIDNGVITHDDIIENIEYQDGGQPGDSQADDLSKRIN